MQRMQRFSAVAALDLGTEDDAPHAARLACELGHAGSGCHPPDRTAIVAPLVLAVYGAQGIRSPLSEPFGGHHDGGSLGSNCTQPNNSPVTRLSPCPGRLKS